MLNIFKIGLPLQLLVVVSGSLLFGNMIPVEGIAVAYAMSLTLKSLLLFVMPFIIFAFIFSCLISFKQGTMRFLTFLLGSICLSNFICTLIAFGVGMLGLAFFSQLSMQAFETGAELVPAWTFSLQRLVSNDVALFLGLTSGLVFSYLRVEAIERLSEQLKSVAHFILSRLFIPLLPIFILGFILKMQHEGILFNAIITYAPVVILFVVTQLVYISFLYALATDFSLKRWLQALKNVAPAGLTAVSTMSSLAALPYTLKAAKENTKNHPLVDIIVPSTVNVHLMGDSIAIPMMALVILYSMGMPSPSLSIYLIFAFYFVINKFAVAAVPGGGILVMLPVLQQYLGFNDEMLSLITMLYILFDALITCANVLGNGAFSILMTRVFKQNSKQEFSSIEREEGVFKKVA